MRNGAASYRERLIGARDPQQDPRIRQVDPSSRVPGMCAQHQPVLVMAAFFFAAAAFYTTRCYSQLGPQHGRTIFFGVSALLMLAVPGMLRILGPKPSGVFLNLLLVAHLFVAQYMGSGTQPGPLPWLSLVPFCGVLLVGLRFGIALGVLLIALQGGLYALLDHGHVYTGDGRLLLSQTDLLVSTTLAIASGTALSAWYAWLRIKTETRRVRALSELEESHTALERAKNEAETADRAKTHFVANVSHELRTPLNGVVGMADLLLDSQLGADQREFAETIQRSSRALLGIIDDVLDLSKLDFEKLRLDATTFELEQIIDEVLALLGGQAYAKGIELSGSLLQQVPRDVVGDPGRLRQVLLNLVSNAIKFTEDGEIEVVARLDGLSGRTAWIRFEVRDTGIGMEPDVQDHIFDFFYQSEDTGESGGSGLGLAISDRLVRLMGGQIHVESVRGDGSTFWFSVPFEVSPDWKQRPDERSYTLSGLRTLVVLGPERPFLRRALSRILSAEGVVAFFAPTAEAARKKLNTSSRPDAYRLVIVDANLPDSDAVSIALDLQAQAGTTMPPATLMLAEPGQRNLRERAEKVGIPVPVVKPVRRGALMAGISAALTDVASAGRLRAQLRSRSPTEPRARLLLAEDNATSRRTAVLMLKRLGYACHAVDNGRQVLEALDEGRYDAILMDLHMPALNGAEATQAIRQRPGPERHVPIIAMTAQAGARERRRCLDAGMNDHLPKPVAIDALELMLERWLFGSPRPDRSEGISSIHSAVDLGVVETLREMADDDNLVIELLEGFLRDAPRTVARARDRATAGDHSGAADAAHKLKSAAGNLGAHALSQLSLRLETAGRAGPSPDLEQLVHDVEVELEQVVEALSRRVEALRRPAN